MYFSLIKADLAAHTRSFLKEMKTIALGEFIENEWLVNKVKNTIEETEFSEESIVDEVGNILLFGIILVFISIIVFLIGRTPLCGIAIQRLKKKLFWNTFIRYSLLSYLQIAFVGIPGLSLLS